MKLKFIPLSLSCGILAALWTYASIKLGWPTWAAFIGWALFFVAGGDTKALWKAGLPAIVGVLFGHVALYGLKLPGEIGGGVIGISVIVGIAALLLVLLMNWAPMALASAAFAAFAAFFAFTFGKFKGDNFFTIANIYYTLLGLLLGLSLGWLSVTIPALFQKKEEA